MGEGELHSPPRLPGASSNSVNTPCCVNSPKGALEGIGISAHAMEGALRRAIRQVERRQQETLRRWLLLAVELRMPFGTLTQSLDRSHVAEIAFEVLEHDELSIGGALSDGGEPLVRSLLAQNLTGKLFTGRFSPMTAGHRSRGERGYCFAQTENNSGIDNFLRRHMMSVIGQHLEWHPRQGVSFQGLTS